MLLAKQRDVVDFVPAILDGIHVHKELADVGHVVAIVCKQGLVEAQIRFEGSFGLQNKGHKRRVVDIVEGVAVDVMVVFPTGIAWKTPFDPEMRLKHEMILIQSVQP